jgi:hypothetical protein
MKRFLSSAVYVESNGEIIVKNTQGSRCALLWHDAWKPE